jgi:N4-(beta-N-acetylglucosaminyl)-L-asparaginase
MWKLTRRKFFQSAAALAAAGTVRPVSIFGQGKSAANEPKPGPRGPVVIASANGLKATQKAMEMLLTGADALDAVVAGVNVVEEDPEDMSVGYGGLPNEDGVVELDSSVMHGPTCRAGAVAALRNIKTPSRVAKLVMDRTDHVMLVGEGALRFARAHGFKEEDLLTDKARRIWLDWKERHSDKDDWLSPAAAESPGARLGIPVEALRHYGTINCCALNDNGELSGVTTTSGLSFKIPGRVGDSPIIGAGLYVDNEVGAAGSTGRGEAVIKICGAHTVVEAMRSGMSPEEACLHALRRIVATTKEARLRQPDGRPNFDVKFYAVSKDGRHGGASLSPGATYAIFAEGRNRLENCRSLYEKVG